VVARTGAAMIVAMEGGGLRTSAVKEAQAESRSSSVVVAAAAAVVVVVEEKKSVGRAVVVVGGAGLGRFGGGGEAEGRGRFVGWEVIVEMRMRVVGEGARIL
jgi:hypothetical protein